VAKIADRMNEQFGYHNFSRLMEDLILSASEATEVVLIPGKNGEPPKRLFVVARPDESLAFHLGFGDQREEQT
jgi:hypothetical protein